MFKRITCLVVLCAVVGVYGEIDLPPCKIGDDECIKRSMNAVVSVMVKGIPSLKIESSDPLNIKELDGDLAGLKFKFTNAITEGLGKCFVQKATLKLDTNYFRLDLMCPEVNMYGDYKLSGNLIGLDVHGEGQFRIECKNYNVIADMEIKRGKGKDGKEHITVKNYKLKGDITGGVVFNFKNLFNGDKGLSDAVHKFANGNWKEISEQLQAPVLNGNFKSFMTNVNKYLRSVPLERLLVE